MKWNVFFASATGKYHLASDSPCQDSAHHAVMGDALIGVVCDGAGSASEGQRGAEFFTRTVTELIAESIRAGQFPDVHLAPVQDTPGRIASEQGQPEQETPGHDEPTQEKPGDVASEGAPECAQEQVTPEQHAQARYRDYLVPIIGAARAQLAETARSRDVELRNFAATLVGCIALRDRGCFFHIGDGFAVYMRDDGESVLSLPENGEYSNETYFVTDEDWQEHLRITALSEISQGGVIGLMSDGASPFAVNRPRTGFYRPFIDPVVNFLRTATEHNGNQALKNVLADEKTLEITSDDKTLLLALAS